MATHKKPTNDSPAAASKTADPLLKSLKLRVGQFNLLNFHDPGKPCYGRSYTQDEVDGKVEWTSQQLRAMRCHVVGFEEVWSLAPLKAAIAKSGIYPDSYSLVGPGVDGSRPAVALLSVFPIVETDYFDDFPPEVILIFGENGIDLPIKKFQRGVLRCVVKMPNDRLVTFFVAHLKSKRPIVTIQERDDAKASAIGSALSLIVRSAESAALRCLVIDETDGRPQHSKRKGASSPGKSGDEQEEEQSTSAAGVKATTIVLGDLNETVHSTSTEIVTGTKPFKKLPFWVKQNVYRNMLSSTNDVQVRSSDRDVTYSHIFNGRYDVLDHILVSNDLIRSNPLHIGYVQLLHHLNDHLIDATLSERDDWGEGVLRADGDSHWNKSKYTSDHGQCVALIKLFPKGQNGQNRFVARRKEGAENAETNDEGLDDADELDLQYHNKLRI
ncbi:hypothetical protein SmJEL517_g05380 [Synchytrium microbalum]|uniref:Endonuclease/exonuclease/phosphatase domain-containing protein n=1 Tax=Synchytrium microbalum TaxID=1806994 RepID=A0A507BZK6_9FUNG|nr:uncharacterized protein SmJEL517_g05380 [Synchytrium microbalum]TPX31244.1 hypothetical protein SmJEL517_g05380 [Synchytrium microbalum]